MVLPYIIHHRCTRVPHPEPPSHLPPGTIPLGHPSTPAPSILYPASNLDWRFISYMILYMFRCHSSKSSHPLPLPQSSKDFYTSVSLLLSHIQGYHYRLSKFHIYVLVYCIGVFFFWLTSLCIIGSSFIHLIRRSTFLKNRLIIVVFLFPGASVRIQEVKHGIVFPRVVWRKILGKRKIPAMNALSNLQSWS